MATIDQVLSDVQAESTTIASVQAFVAGLRQQLADALANTSVPADVQAKIDQVFDAVEANKVALAGAMTTQPDGTQSAPVDTGASTATEPSSAADPAA